MTIPTWHSETLRQAADGVRAKITDPKLTDFVEQLLHSVDGLGKLLDEEAEDFGQKARREWDALASATDDALQQVETAFRARLEVVHEVQAHAQAESTTIGSESMPTSRRSTVHANPAILLSQEQNDAAIATVRREIAHKSATAAEKVSEDISAQIAAINQQRSALSRVRFARRSRIWIRVGVSIALFLVLYVIVLFLHEPFAHLADKAERGRLATFGLLASLFLPVELARATIEPWIHKKLHGSEHADTKREYQKLASVAAKAVAAIADAN